MPSNDKTVENSRVLVTRQSTLDNYNAYYGTVIQEITDYADDEYKGD